MEIHLFSCQWMMIKQGGVYLFIKCLNAMEYLANWWIYSLQRWISCCLNPRGSGEFWFLACCEVLQWTKRTKNHYFNLIFLEEIIILTVLGLDFDSCAVLNIRRPSKWDLWAVEMPKKKKKNSVSFQLNITIYVAHDKNNSTI